MQQFYLVQLVRGPCFCRRVGYIYQFASPQGAGIYLQIWFLHRNGHQANQAKRVSRPIVTLPFVNIQNTPM